jgi:IS30 family transposase
MERNLRRARRRAKHLIKRKAKRQSVRVKKQELRERIQEIRKQHTQYQLLFLVAGIIFQFKAEPQAENDDEKPVPINPEGKLTLEERQALYLYRSWGWGVNKIARQLRRAPSTISRELKRNRYSSPMFAFFDSYSQAKCAHDEANRRRSAKRQRLRLKTGDVRRAVEELLTTKDPKLGRLSPELISIRLFIERGICISYQAIYEYIYFEARHLIPYLPRAGKKYRRKGAAKRKRVLRQPAAPKTSIDTRPRVVALRLEFGHWEMDTIVSRQSKECLLVIQERVSRFFFVVKLTECSADCAFEAVIKMLKPLHAQGLVKSITCDNGPENSCYERITQALNIPVYFCHPYCSSERGGVENRNGTIRGFFPKKTNFSLVSEAQVEAARQRLINRPMKCLGGYTPYEIFYNTYQPMLKAA